MEKREVMVQEEKVFTWEEHIQDIINTLTNRVVTIEEFTKDKKSFQKMIETYYDFIKQGFEVKELRTCPVYFRFFDREDEIIHQLELRHFLTNLMFWEPLVRLYLYDKIGPDYIVDCTKLSSSLIKGYIDNKIILPFRTTIGNAKMNRVIHDMMHNLSRISTDFNIILGLSINAETFIETAQRNERFNEILRTKIPDDMQPTEIEEHLTNLMHEQIEILKNDEEEKFLRPILLSETGIKDKQLSEFSINGGLKPDLDANTIPIPINSNFIVGGLNNVTNYYIDSLGGRKSVIMNKTVMGRSGHFARMIMLLVADVRMRKDEKDCGTIHPIALQVKTNKHLARLKGRYYRLPHNRQYSIMQGNEKDLIGKTILLRSPITCASDKICKTCYGELYYTNRDIQSIGGYAGAKITEPLSQSILSSKHLLTTQSEKVEFNEDFYRFFSINANEIMLNTQNDDFDFANYSLVMIKKNIETIDAFDENEFNKYVTIFHVLNKRTGEIYEIQKEGSKELYISPELNDLIKEVKKNFKGKDAYEIDLTKFNDDDRIFVVEIANNELTKPLYSIMYLLNRKDHEGCETIDEMANTLLDLLIESKINSESVHGEILIRALIRSQSDVLKLPDFTKYDAMNDYQILTVDGALQRHPSVLVSLSFQDLGRQLTNPLTFRKRESSFIDPFFEERP